MKNANHERLAAVNELLEFQGTLDQLALRLSQFSWDFEGSQTVLTRSHIAAVLGRYLEGQISAPDVECWANLVEGREDIAAESEFKTLVECVIYELANPTLTYALDADRALELRRCLSAG